MKYPLKVPTSKDKIYGQFLRIINFLIYDLNQDGSPERSPLTNKELDVLASMMYYNDRYRNLPDIERAEYIMSSEIRKRIRAKLDIKANHLNNVISRLKTKYYMGYPILEDNKLSAPLNIYLDQDTTIEFNLIYEEPAQSSDRTNNPPSQKVQLRLRQSEGTSRTDREVVEPLNLDD